MAPESGRWKNERIANVGFLELIPRGSPQPQTVLGKAARSHGLASASYHVEDLGKHWRYAWASALLPVGAVVGTSLHIGRVVPMRLKAVCANRQVLWMTLLQRKLGDAGLCPPQQVSTFFTDRWPCARVDSG